VRFETRVLLAAPEGDIGPRGASTDRQLRSTRCNSAIDPRQSAETSTYDRLNGLSIDFLGLRARPLLHRLILPETETAPFQTGEDIF
jgi:hypothetical protein